MLAKRQRRRQVAVPAYAPPRADGVRRAWMLKVWMVVRGLSAAVILIMAGLMILMLFGIKIEL